MRLEVMAKEAKNALILRSSGIVNANGFDNSASVFSKRGDACRSFASPGFQFGNSKKLHRFNMWKRSYIRTCAAIYHDLGQHCKINSFCSGIAALTIIRQMVPDDFRSYWVFLGSRNSDQKSLMPR
ncbi:hypothetical protein RHMOL_Rhmol12G0148500 [Rhododendron molle]|uniref:Uncharacterized protein n=1 Tax=Rhododendron molle TaxID=49168 RepID=A0ACC0LIJ1_RHOML|nr:hypothetical protein RHMOL_Rhmol12G0148500 [Rhododendron molle]